MISTRVNRKINPLTQYLDATYPLQSTQINGIDMDAKNVHRTRLGASCNRISGLGVSQPKRLAYLCFTVAEATHLFLSENYECLKYILQKIITPYAEARIR